MSSLKVLHGSIIKSHLAFFVFISEDIIPHPWFLNNITSPRFLFIKFDKVLSGNYANSESFLETQLRDFQLVVFSFKITKWSMVVTICFIQSWKILLTENDVALYSIRLFHTFLPTNSNHVFWIPTLEYTKCRISEFPNGQIECYNESWFGKVSNLTDEWNDQCKTSIKYAFDSSTSRINIIATIIEIFKFDQKKSENIGPSSANYLK